MWIELVLLVLLFLTALVIIRLEDLFAAAMLTGIFSLLSAGLFTVMDAVDVAFTEAAVGAGIATILFLGALSLTATRERQQGWRWQPLVVVVLTGSALLYGVTGLAEFGDPEAPAHQHVAPEYIEGAHEMHIPNVVTVVLASYRGYDTLGETVVVLTAAVGVLMLLGHLSGAGGGLPSPSSEPRGATRGSGKLHMRMRETAVLRVTVRLLIPFILLFAFYVQFHGDFGPGGGFQAGVIFAAGFILFGLIYDPKVAGTVFPPRMAEALIAIGVLLYGSVGVATMLLGGSFLDYDALDAEHGQHWGILLVEAGVGITVAATMTRLYYAFSSIRPETTGATRGTLDT